MSFTIPNVADAFNPNQAEIDPVDLEVLAAAIGQRAQGVISGCAVTAQGPATMSLDVAAGSVQAGNVPAEVTAGTVTIGVADPTNPRIDLVVADSTGAKQVRAGAAAAEPVYPSLSAGDTLLAAVYVPANDTAIDANQITDKRCFVRGMALIRKSSNEVVNASAVAQDDDHLKFFMAANEVWRVEVYVYKNAGAANSDMRYTFGVPTGATMNFAIRGVGQFNTSQTGDFRSIVWNADATDGAVPQITAGRVTGFVLNAGTPGQCTFKWAQTSARAHDTTVYAGSWLIAWKLN